MQFSERMGLAALHKMDPEAAHGLAIKALRYGLTPKPGPFTSPRLSTTVAGLSLPNPIGLAAGFDKNAEALAPLMRSGFGFIEVGAATPLAQPGNPKPRLFRLTPDRAVINRFGFNNQGADTIAARLAQRPKDGIIGLNLGANKDSADRASDFVRVLEICGPHVDFVTVNVSSPNTANLRDLQGKAALWGVLTGVLEARAKLAHPLPVFLKIAPDLDADALRDIAEVARDSSLDAIIATNTTLSRAGLKDSQAPEAGGLSGAPLMSPSTRILAQLSELTDGKVPLIGVGGIESAQDAYAKIKAGASAVQLYSALIYKGLSLVTEIAQGLDALLAADSYDHISQAVGVEREAWL